VHGDLHQYERRPERHCDRRAGRYPGALFRRQ
jgi:hypothetical protein